SGLWIVMTTVNGEGRAEEVGKAERAVQHDGTGPTLRKAVSAATEPAAASSAQSDGTGSATKAAAKGRGLRLELPSNPVIIGAAVLLLGAGALCSRGRPRGHHFGAKLHGLGLQGSGLQPPVAEQADAAEDAGAASSLEDILRKLEDGQEAPVDLSSAAEAGGEAARERKASKKRPKKAKKPRAQEAEAPAAAAAPAEAPEAAEEPLSEQASRLESERVELQEQAARPAPEEEEAPELKEDPGPLARATLQQLESASQQPGGVGEGELQEAKDALRRMEEAGTASKDSDMKVEDVGEEEEEDPRVHEIMEEVLEKISKASKSKSAKVTKRKVKAAINNALEKLEALGDSASRDDLKERLRDMLELEEDESPKSKKGKAERSKKEEEEAELHMDFAQRVKEETAKKLDFSIADVKEEFRQTYGKDAKSLMCSGCKLVAARLAPEPCADGYQSNEEFRDKVGNLKENINFPPNDEIEELASSDSPGGRLANDATTTLQDHLQADPRHPDPPTLGHPLQGEGLAFNEAPNRLNQRGAALAD
ncbi:unnamed protein product, partial [Prorocentrum cordatum]